MTAFESFKRTPAYKAILTKMGKDVPICSETKLTVPIQSEHVKRLRRVKLYPYHKYLEHLRSGKCHRQRIFECPLNCGMSGDEITSKMTYR